ncbi:RTA1 like protein-domain-containing protein [Phyllosticta citribraziliensis]|uniref:RTA1 like protein-domain-containing protein n=1 Tax=Phyllosticta citribraziliensis TaxID=989973 RepID=A0ABR1LPC1_9PEZI
MAEGKNDHYKYDPSSVAAIVFAVLFGLSSALHIAQMLKMRTWYMTAFIFGALFETVAYVFRAVNTFEDYGHWTLVPFILQAVLSLVAPSLLAASIYMILGRIILLTDAEPLSMMRKRWLTKFFVVGDVFAFLVQCMGAGILSGADSRSSQDRGEMVIIIGLIVQLLFFGFFIIVAAVFHWRLNKSPTEASLRPETRWRYYLTALYGTSLFILVRCLFRLIEYIQGQDGYLLSKEVFLYVFDAVLMFLVCAWFNWWHPSEIGVLLRGDKAATNGFALLRSREKTLDNDNEMGQVSDIRSHEIK